jgi:predicted HTH transcriptional regulator
MPEQNGGFMVTLFHSSRKKVTEKVTENEKLPEKLPEKLGENLQKIVAIMKNNPFVTIGELANELNISTTAIKNNINKLKKTQYYRENRFRQRRLLESKTKLRILSLRMRSFKKPI